MKLRGYGIGAKLSILTTIFATFIIVSLSLVYFGAEKAIIVKNIYEKQNMSIESLAKVVEESLVIQDDLMILSFIKNLKTDNSIDYAEFVDDKNIVVAHTDSAFIGKRFNKEKPLNSNIIYREIEGLGFVNIGFSKSYAGKQIRAVTVKSRNRFIMISLIAVLSGIILSLVFSYGIIKPIYTLAKGADEIGNGNLDYRFDIHGTDELGHLSEAFNKMTAKLKELDNMKKDFIASVTHELRLPIANIVSYINLMKDNPEAEIKKNGLENLEGIRKNAVRLEVFIDNLLEAAKIEKKEMELNKKEFDIAAMIKESVEMFSASAKEKNISVEFNFHDKSIPVHGDPDKLRQVITNIISNAMKYNYKGGKISINLKETVLDGRRYSVVSVADTGIGIPKESQSKIFEKFERVSLDWKKLRKEIGSSKGIGLGLAIVKEIVAAHNGKIWLESEQNKGTTFYIALPK